MCVLCGLCSPARGSLSLSCRNGIGDKTTQKAASFTPTVAWLVMINTVYWCFCSWVLCVLFLMCAISLLSNPILFVTYLKQYNVKAVFCRFIIDVVGFKILQRKLLIYCITYTVLFNLTVHVTPYLSFCIRILLYILILYTLIYCLYSYIFLHLYIYIQAISVPFLVNKSVCFI